MESQKVEEKVQLQQSFESESKTSWIRPISLGLGVIGVGLAIGIGGYLLGAKSNKTIVQDSQKKIVAVSPTATPDPTANWKTYINAGAGYSFKYPNDYQVMENQKKSVDGVTVNTPNTTTVLSSILPNLNTNMQIGIHYESQLSDLSGDDVAKKLGLSTTATTYNINGKSGFIFTDTRLGAYGSTIIYIITNNKSYTFTIESHASYAQYKKYLDQILSTFKFTDNEAIVSPTPTPTPTPLPAYQIIQRSSLNTYTNNVYNFSFNFPKSLFLYSGQSNSEYAGFLQKQGNINALRMYVDVFKNPNNLSLEEVEDKYNLKVNQGNIYALEKTTTNGKETLIVAGNKSMRELCSYNDDQKRRVVVAALVKGPKYVLVFNTNNTCETFQEDWFSGIVNSVRL